VEEEAAREKKKRKEKKGNFLYSFPLLHEMRSFFGTQEISGPFVVA
jgi:hypothetical protein